MPRSLSRGLSIRCIIPNSLFAGCSLTAFTLFLFGRVILICLLLLFALPLRVLTLCLPPFRFWRQCSFGVCSGGLWETVCHPMLHRQIGICNNLQGELSAHGSTSTPQHTVYPRCIQNQHHPSAIDSIIEYTWLMLLEAAIKVVDIGIGRAPSAVLCPTRGTRRNTLRVPMIALLAVVRSRLRNSRCPCPANTL